MKATPQITADIDDYPELATILEASIRRVVELMEVHDIIELRRVRKTGVFDHKYDKDIVTPIGIPSVPPSINATRYAVGKALLDYLGTVGVSGLTLTMTQEDVRAVASIWDPRLREQTKDKPESKEGADPEPIDGGNEANEKQVTAEKDGKPENGGAEDGKSSGHEEGQA